jgi:hypothetical protein
MLSIIETTEAMGVWEQETDVTSDIRSCTERDTETDTDNDQETDRETDRELNHYTSSIMTPAQT